jgi:hypothetical protein
MTARRFAAVMIAVAAAICPLILAEAGQAVAGTRPRAGAHGAATGTWQTAKNVPGVMAMNKGGQAQIQSVSCASGGNCTAGGDYTGSSGHRQAFVVSQVNGSWRTAVQVPGIASLNKGGNANNFSVSCAFVATQG